MLKGLFSTTFFYKRRHSDPSKWALSTNPTFLGPPLWNPLKYSGSASVDVDCLSLASPRAPTTALCSVVAGLDWTSYNWQLATRYLPPGNTNHQTELALICLRFKHCRSPSFPSFSISPLPFPSLPYLSLLNDKHFIFQNLTELLDKVSYWQI